MNKKIVQEIRVNKSKANTRLDIFLSEELGVTRSKVQNWIKNGLVEVSDKQEVPKYLVNTGDRINIFQIDKKEIPNVEIIYEDKDILVIDKPAGITSHPAPGETQATIAEILSDKYTGKQGTERDLIVHRLDKGTSGVMVLAKNAIARKSLIDQFASRKVNKIYWALVRGRVIPDEGVIDIPLARNILIKNQIAAAEEGKDAKTIYKVLRHYQGFTLVSASPKTGRTHQIRVHFTAIGHPLWGDERYGTHNDSADRIFLHAREISFIHPTTKKRVKFVSPLPKELETVLSKLTIE